MSEPRRATFECPHATDSLAFVQRELSEVDSVRFREHLRACPCCREEVRSHRELLGSLGRDRDSLAAAYDAGSFTSPVPTVQTVPELDASPRIHRRGLARLAIGAASLAAVVAISVSLSISDAPPAGGVAGGLERLALDWFSRTQGADGLWRSADFGGDARFDVGVSALGLLAFLGAPEGAEQQIDAAADGLLRTQAADGLFGTRFFGAPYNHGIATTALMELAALRPELRERVEPTLRRAVDWLVRAQSPDGGWSYFGADGSNTATTYWPLQALLLANAVERGLLGGAAVDSSIERAFGWLASVSDERGNVGYRRQAESIGTTLVAKAAVCEGMRTLGGGLPTAMGRRWIDRLARGTAAPGSGDSAYGDLLTLTAMHLHASAGSTRRADRLHAQARERLQAAVAPGRAAKDGEDRWEAFGGRLYTAATATLALQSERRLERWRGLLVRG